MRGQESYDTDGGVRFFKKSSFPMRGQEWYAAKLDARVATRPRSP